MKKELIAQRNPKSPISELFRTLRTNIQFMNSQKGLKSILITSTMPGEGKSWVSANLAVTFAQTGKKVVLVDADMRKGRLANLFQTEKSPGLSNFLSGIDEKGITDNADIIKYIKPTEVENLFLIPTGNVPPNPAELLGSEATRKMMDKLKEIFDVIILDGTPNLLVTDAALLGRVVDTTILVAAYKSTKKEDLQKVKRNIENVGGKIAGVVLNKVPIRSKEYETSYYYGSKPTSTSKSKGKRAIREKEIREEEERPRVTREERIQNNDVIKHEEVKKEEGISQSQQDEILSQLNEYLKNNKD